MEGLPRNSIQSGERGTFNTNNENTPLQKDKAQDDGLRYIITTFAVATVILTIALGVTISQEGRKAGLRADVTSDSPVCTNIGKNILLSGGNAVDAAVAVTICLGIVSPHLTGIGGNGLILIYNQKLTKPVLCLDSWTPGKNALPKLLLALFTIHKNQGKKKWHDIIEPSIKLAKEGFTVTESLVLSKEHVSEFAEKNLIFWINSLKVGENITSPKLAETFEIIQSEGPDALYKGKLSTELKKLYSDISDLSLNDGPCLESTVEGYSLVSSGKESGGSFLHKAISEANLTHDFKISKVSDFLLGRDEISWPIPAGVVVCSSDDDDIYVSIVSGLGPILGSQILSVHGYIFGSNFALPKSPFLGSIGSAFVASDAYSRCKKRIITGGVDVRDLLLVVPGLLWGSTDPQTVVEAPRIHFSNQGIFKETNYISSSSFSIPLAPSPYPTINVIKKFADSILSYADPRSGS